MNEGGKAFAAVREADAALDLRTIDGANEGPELPNRFAELAAIDISKFVDKKGAFSYLSWTWAIDRLLRYDPDAAWEYGTPVMYGETMMLFCTVTAFGKPRTMQLPVMDHHHKAIKNPDARAISDAMQRCLVKAIALHGLGLYIYSGEDVPRAEDAEPPPRVLTEAQEHLLQQMRDASLEGMEAFKKAWRTLSPEDRDVLHPGHFAHLKKAATLADKPNA